jgi:hypothetical protein
MDKIEQCVSDVVAIANGARDHEQAKARMKELLDDAKFQLGQWFSTAQRLRDQLRVVYSDVETVSAKQFLDELMAPRQMKMPTKKDFDNEHEEVFSQRKRPESGRYLLQVDRQTKGSYKTSEAAQVAGREIKAAYPIVQVSIYDSIDNTHTLVAVTPAS